MSAAPQQPFPNLDSPLVDENGDITQPWYRLLIAIWKKTGGSSSILNSVYLTTDIFDPSLLNVYDTSTNELLGTVNLNSLAPAAQNIVVSTPSPFTYLAVRKGTLVVFSSKVELNRLNGAWIPVTLQGGAIPMQRTDQARMTWFGVDPPTLTFLPD